MDFSYREIGAFFIAFGSIMAIRNVGPHTILNGDNDEDFIAWMVHKGVEEDKAKEMLVTAKEVILKFEFDDSKSEQFKVQDEQLVSQAEEFCLIAANYSQSVILKELFHGDLFVESLGEVDLSVKDVSNDGDETAAEITFEDGSSAYADKDHTILLTRGD